MKSLAFLLYILIYPKVSYPQWFWSYFLLVKRKKLRATLIFSTIKTSMASILVRYAFMLAFFQRWLLVVFFNKLCCQLKFWYFKSSCMCLR